MFGLAIYSTTTWLILGAVFAIAAVYVLRLKWGSRQIDDEPDSYQTIDLGDAPGQIAVQPWMVSPETSAVFDAIEAAGGEIRFVGGCVRDAVLKRTIKDIDLATTLLPEASQKALEAAGLKVVPTGIKHGTVTCISGGQSYEITTLRLDEETDGRHATVAFTVEVLDGEFLRAQFVKAFFGVGAGLRHVEAERHGRTGRFVRVGRCGRGGKDRGQCNARACNGAGLQHATTRQILGHGFPPDCLDAAHLLCADRGHYCAKTLSQSQGKQINKSL